jgi:hypothetical protein
MANASGVYDIEILGVVNAESPGVLISHLLEHKATATEATRRHERRRFAVRPDTQVSALRRSGRTQRARQEGCRRLLQPCFCNSSCASCAKALAPAPLSLCPAVSRRAHSAARISTTSGLIVTCCENICVRHTRIGNLRVMKVLLKVNGGAACCAMPSSRSRPCEVSLTVRNHFEGPLAILAFDTLVPAIACGTSLPTIQRRKQRTGQLNGKLQPYNPRGQRSP